MSMLTFIQQRKVYNVDGCDNVISDVFADGVWICYVLEDKIRADGDKVDGETAIPADTYDVKITMSGRFKRLMPLVYNKPDGSIDSHGKKFAGVRLHGGQTEAHTHGCPLVALKVNATQTAVNTSAEALITKMIQDRGGKAKWIIEDRGLTGGGLNKKMAA